MRRRQLRVKEEWQEPSDGKKRSDGRTVYGKSQSVNLPFRLAVKVEQAAKEKGVSQSRYIAESLAETLGVNLQD